MTRIDLLRLLLPSAQSKRTSPVRCAWRTPHGTWQSAIFQDLTAIASSYQPRRVEVCPHPADVSMTEIELPPLSAKRQRIAILGAIEMMALTPPKSLAVGFGPRSDKGTVPVAWMSASALSMGLRELQDHGLSVHAVLPPSAFLPNPSDRTWPEKTAGAMRIDDWVVVRTSTNEGILHPAPAEQADLVQVDARLRPFLSDSLQLHWLPFGDAVKPEHSQEPGPWTGTGWKWTISMGESAAHRDDLLWLRPAMGWAAVTVSVCLLGLNLHAAQVAAQGQALTRQMAAQVKAAFPEVSVVLNPLKQARQLHDARQTGASSVESADFAALTRACAVLLTRAQGQVQHLDFRDGQLQIRWREGATLSSEEMKALQAQSQERGLAVQFEDSGLRLQLASGTKSGNVANPARVAPWGAASGAKP
jgi:general secretion pathway protein L